MDSGHYTFVQTHRMYNSKREPKGEVWTWVITTCQCSFTKGNKCTALVGDTGREEAVHVYMYTQVYGILGTLHSMLLLSIKVL